MESLKDKVVIVTGAGSGIGAATAILFSKYGSRIVITGKNEDNLKNVSEHCEHASPNKYKPLIVVGDISDDEFQKTLLESTLLSWNKLDILVNNAFIGKMANIDSHDFQEVFKDVMNDNLRAPVMLTRLALPHLTKSDGCVINITGDASFHLVSDSALPLYMAKKALDSMTPLLAKEYGSKGVRVLSISAGTGKSSVQDHFKNLYDTFAKKAAPGTAEQVANVICFMASSGASYVNGTNIVVDGGHSLE